MNGVPIAAFQAPLFPPGRLDAVEAIRRRVLWCEARHVGFLLCPEAILGGLADQAERPANFALRVRDGQLRAALAPLASERVTTILGFTEIEDDGRLFNSAAVFHRGEVVGVYRKIHPARRKSVYQPGAGIPVFTVNGLTFGIVICNDSNHPDLARTVAAQGATVLFVPTNNALPPDRAVDVDDAMTADVASARETGLAIVRADVAGEAGGLVSYGSSSLTDPSGSILSRGQRLEEDILVAEFPPRRI